MGDRAPADQGRVGVPEAPGMRNSLLDMGPAGALVRLRAPAIAAHQTAGRVALAVVGRTRKLERDDHEGTEKSPR